MIGWQDYAMWKMERRPCAPSWNQVKEDEKIAQAIDRLRAGQIHVEPEVSKAIADGLWCMYDEWTDESIQWLTGEAA